jgi:sporulation protein YunB
MRRKRRWLILFLAAVLALLALRAKIDPLTAQLAQAQVSNLASHTINQAVAQALKQDDIQYGDLINLERDTSGNITALTTNMLGMNRLKTGLLSLLDGEEYDITGELLNIPLGNLSGIQLLSGRGPSIPVKVLAVSSTDAWFTGEFTEAGINQTLHRIMLTVTLDVLLLLPTGTVSQTVSTEVCVAETVLLGQVPDSYTYFNGFGNEESQ